jgi:serine/threonine-protein phosphatase 2A activator
MAAFVVPETKIRRPEDLEVFKRSETAKTLQRFVSLISQYVQGRQLSDPVPRSPLVAALVGVLDELLAWVAAIPRVPQTSRYGNLAYREWSARLAARTPDLIAGLPGLPAGADTELAPYFAEAFGNGSRIDYGSGHELSFVAFLCCLHLVHAVADADLAAIGLVVIPRYLDVVRALQRTYSLEPAGSHGVWGLDDHQLLPYLWGASQLCGGGATVSPNDIPSRDAARRYGDENMFFACVRFIFEVKTGPFHEHSRYLYDMSAVPDWNKVAGVCVLCHPCAESNR